MVNASEVKINALLRLFVWSIWSECNRKQSIYSIDTIHRFLLLTEIKGLPWWLRLKHLPTMRETQVQYLGREDPLEKEMATHSSTLAWKIPWMEEHGGLQSMGSQRVGHDWATLLHFINRFLVYIDIKPFLLSSPFWYSVLLMHA